MADGGEDTSVEVAAVQEQGDDRDETQQETTIATSSQIAGDENKRSEVTTASSSSSEAKEIANIGVCEADDEPRKILSKEAEKAETTMDKKVEGGETTIVEDVETGEGKSNVPAAAPIIIPPFKAKETNAVAHPEQPKTPSQITTKTATAEASAQGGNDMKTQQATKEVPACSQLSRQVTKPRIVANAVTTSKMTHAGLCRTNKCCLKRCRFLFTENLKLKCCIEDCTKDIHWTCYQVHIVQRNKLKPLFLDNIKDGTHEEVVFCSKSHYDEAKKILSGAYTKTESKRQVSWTSDSTGGVNDPITSESILLKWMTTPGNYAGFKSRNVYDGERRLNMMEIVETEVCPLFKKAGILAERTPSHVYQKMTYLRGICRSTSDWAKSTRGAKWLKQKGEKAFHQELLQRFPYYFDLEPIFKQYEKKGLEVDHDQDNKADGTSTAMSVSGKRISRENWDSDGPGGIYDPISSNSILIDWLKTPGNVARFVHGCRDENGKKRNKEVLSAEIQKQIIDAGIIRERPLLSIYKKIYHFLIRYRQAYLWETSPEGAAMLKNKGLQDFNKKLRQICKHYHELRDCLGSSGLLCNGAGDDEDIDDAASCDGTGGEESDESSAQAPVHHAVQPVSMNRRRSTAPTRDSLGSSGLLCNGVGDDEDFDNTASGDGIGGEKSDESSALAPAHHALQQLSKNRRSTAPTNPAAPLSSKSHSKDKRDDDEDYVDEDDHGSRSSTPSSIQGGRLVRRNKRRNSNEEMESTRKRRAVYSDDDDFDVELQKRRSAPAIQGGHSERKSYRPNSNDEMESTGKRSAAHSDDGYGDVELQKLSAKIRADELALAQEKWKEEKRLKQQQQELAQAKWDEEKMQKHFENREKDLAYKVQLMRRYKELKDMGFGDSEIGELITELKPVIRARKNMPRDDDGLAYA